MVKEIRRTVICPKTGLPSVKINKGETIIGLEPVFDRHGYSIQWYILIECPSEVIDLATERIKRDGKS